jgi:hypothetical protein
LNTVLFLNTTLKENPETLAINRCGTAAVEHFFGATRIALRNDVRWESFLLASAKGIVLSKILSKYKLKLPIKRNINLAGIHILNGNSGYVFRSESPEHFCFEMQQAIDLFGIHSTDLENLHQFFLELKHI